MPDSTSRYQIPFDLLRGDTPNGAQMGQDIAEAVEAALGTIDDRTVTIPAGDGTTYSAYLNDTGGGDLGTPDMRLTQSATTDIITVSFTLAHAQNVMLGAKACLAADASSGAIGACGVCIAVDGTRVTGRGEAGHVLIGTPGTSTAQVTTSIPTFGITLAAGSHTVKLQADRDNAGLVNARSKTTPNGRTYRPTSLAITI